MITGRTLPALSCVRALNCLQNSMMFTPFAPNAGPIGGDGLAAPPLIWSLIRALTSFAILQFLLVLWFLLCWKRVTAVSIRRIPTGAQVILFQPACNSARVVFCGRKF